MFLIFMNTLYTIYINTVIVSLTSVSIIIRLYNFHSKPCILYPELFQTITLYNILEYLTMSHACHYIAYTECNCTVPETPDTLHRVPPTLPDKKHKKAVTLDISSLGLLYPKC